MNPFNFPYFQYPLFAPLNPGQGNPLQPAPIAPGPYLQPLFQQAIPPQMAMANPMAFNPLGNFPFQIPFNPLPAMQTVPQAIFDGQALPTAVAAEPMEQEDSKGLKRKLEDTVSNGEATKKARLEDGALKLPAFREGYFNLDETLLHPAEKEDLLPKLKRQQALENMYGAALDDVQKLIFGGSITQEQRQVVVDFLEDLLQQGYARSAAALAFLSLKYPADLKFRQEDALSYYKRGAELGCGACSFSFGANLRKKNPDGAKNTEVAYCWRVAAALGHPEARYNYAQYLLQGIGVEADPATALKLIEENAEILTQPEAEYKFASELRSGVHVTKDLPRAYELFTRAAAKGHAVAEINLAACFYYGQGTAVNKPEACAVYKRCADRGHKVAQYNYSVMKLLGDGVETNVEE
ncbi:tetratricopeptide repeat protein, partial [Estrella lausannensis]|uniref:tetratricopeptide repeat protein n=1 Tax=Estrella lausannensis TaxID=483423 RepID=UPI001179BAE5